VKVIVVEHERIRMEHLGRNKNPIRKLGAGKPEKIFFITYPDMKDLELVLKKLEQRKTDCN
jgi:hypothetical protein